MGCDIHLYVEKREKGKWISADVWEKIEYDPKDKEVPYKKSFYHDRNYRLFSILADVRNGYGFAGCDTGDGFKPIAKPKGFPSDASKELKQDNNRWEGDGHSHSWFTVSELMEYDWTQVSKIRGHIDALTYWEWLRWKKGEGENPDTWSGGISGPTIRHISEQEMVSRLNEITEGKSYEESEAVVKTMLKDVYCIAEWEQPYYKCAKEFLSETLPRLWRLGKPEDVRIVFWFDN